MKTTASNGNSADDNGDGVAGVDARTAAQDYDDAGVRALSAAILLGAVEDWRKTASKLQLYVPSEFHGEPFCVTRSELREFFASEWFETLCEIVEMPKYKMLRKLNVTSNMPAWKEKWYARRRESRRKRRLEKTLLRGAR